MKYALHSNKMISKPRKLYSKYKLPSAPHNTTQYLMSNYETDPKNYPTLCDEYNHGSMMGNSNYFKFYFININLISFRNRFTCKID